MFQAVNHGKVASVLPRGCTFAAGDWEILSRFWHPVAFELDIGEAPVRARLLDVDLVIWRTAAGLSVARDICPHRGTRLSAGRVVAGELVCPMHGLCYAPEGACTRIPSVADPAARIPPRLQLQMVQSEARYGILFACLAGDPIWPLPDWPGIRDDSLPKIHVPSGTWYAAASRHVENFNDIAHFPWVHQATFGAADAVPVPRYDVRETAAGLAFDMPYLEGGNRFPDGVVADNRQVTYHYELTYPFSTIIIIRPEGSDYAQFFADTVCPVSAHETRIFQVVTDTTGKPDRDFLIAESLLINDEDKPMVEGQHPEDLPLDLTEEIHIPADRFSVTYRRALVAKFGLGAPITS